MKEVGRSSKLRSTEKKSRGFLHVLQLFVLVHGLCNKLRPILDDHKLSKARRKFRDQLFKNVQLSLRSKRSRTTLTKFGPREGVFSHSGCTKNEARAKKRKEGGGGGKRRERLPTNPSNLKNAHWFSRLSSFIDRAARISFAPFGNACYDTQAALNLAWDDGQLAPLYY